MAELERRQLSPMDKLKAALVVMTVIVTIGTI